MYILDMGYTTLVLHSSHRNQHANSLSLSLSLSLCVCVCVCVVCIGSLHRNQANYAAACCAVHAHLSIYLVGWTLE